MQAAFVNPQVTPLTSFFPKYLEEKQIAGCMVIRCWLTTGVLVLVRFAVIRVGVVINAFFEGSQFSFQSA